MNDAALSDARTSSRHLADLLRREHGALADFLLALAEFDRTEAFRSLGFANVFDYLHRELRLSRAAAHFRKVAARLVARFPEVVEPLRDGRLCLTSVVEIRPAAVVPRRAVVTEVPSLPAATVEVKVRPGLRILHILRQ